MTRTATTEACAYAVHTFGRLHLGDEHVARLGHALPGLWHVVECDQSSVAGHPDNACYGQRLAIQDYWLPIPAND